MPYQCQTCKRAGIADHALCPACYTPAAFDAFQLVEDRAAAMSAAMRRRLPHVRIVGPCGAFVIMAPGQRLEDEPTDDNSRYVGTDYDWPGVASRMGWSPCCGWTDGTVDCEEHERTAGDMIREAGEWIRAREGRGFRELADYFAGAENFVA